MKVRFFSVLVVCMYGVCSLAYSQEAGTIHFNTMEIDYGVIKKDSDGKRRFIVTNVGKAPLIISNCAGTCGCTIVNCPGEAIPAGKSALLYVKYNTSRIGEFSKQVTVYSNDPKNPMSIIRIKGSVIEDSISRKEE